MFKTLSKSSSQTLQKRQKAQIPVSHSLISISDDIVQEIHQAHCISWTGFNTSTTYLSFLF